MTEIVLGVVIVLLIALNAFQLWLRTRSESGLAGDYERVLSQMAERNRELITQVVKLALSKNVAEYTTSNLMEQPVRVGSDSKREEFVSTETADNKTFDKMIKMQLQPEEEVDMNG